VRNGKKEGDGRSLSVNEEGEKSLYGSRGEREGYEKQASDLQLFTRRTCGLQADAIITSNNVLRLSGKGPRRMSFGQFPGRKEIGQLKAGKQPLLNRLLSREEQEKRVRLPNLEKGEGNCPIRRGKGGGKKYDLPISVLS